MISGMVHTNHPQTMLLSTRLWVAGLLLVAHIVMIGHAYADDHATEDTVCHQCMAVERCDDLVPPDVIAPPRRLTFDAAHVLRTDGASAATIQSSWSRGPPTSS